MSLACNFNNGEEERLPFGGYSLATFPATADSLAFYSCAETVWRSMTSAASDRLVEIRGAP